MEKQVTKLLLFDFFSGKTTVIQRKLIEEWLEDEKNAELYYCYLDEWESENPQFFPDLQKANDRYKLQLEFTETEGKVDDKGINTGKWHRKRLYYGLVAASIVTGIFFSSKEELMYKSLKSSKNNSSSFVLSDGTKVLLNANSILRVPRFDFGNEARIVELDGEADFDVTHTKTNNRFIVKMGGNYHVEVLGTQFVAYARNEEKRVFLMGGKVKLQLPEGKQVYMKPGTLFTSKSDNNFQISTPASPQMYTGWKEHLFYFDNTRLSEVAQQMNERFGIDVRIQGDVLSNRKIGGIYRAETLDDLLEILTELLHVEVVKNQDFVELSIPKPNQYDTISIP